ncbi:META domain-containing protein [Thiothrix lacustris]|uniref:META domain-containing protein n=1 Tax=Thiothrix lacustris TaxID=525917 RepID=A0ABY9MQL6_9GAMM|nr:META domain-containing protein [Thiothrix lacustris]WML90465.1 META domain-containing protein [Thiothrix lacustris]
MSMQKPISKSFMQTRRDLLLLPLMLMAERVLAVSVPELPAGSCPLNSGGPSLLGTKWRLYSVYDNKVPPELDVTMEVGDNALKGFAGCNDYTAVFQRVGHTGFKMAKIERGEKGCPVLSTGAGLPTINVGSWEGSYLRTLGRAGSVQQEGSLLQFFNMNGAPSVVFTKHYGDAGVENAAPETPPAEGTVPAPAPEPAPPATS